MKVIDVEILKKWIKDQKIFDCVLGDSCNYINRYDLRRFIDANSVEQPDKPSKCEHEYFKTAYDDDDTICAKCGEPKPPVDTDTKPCPMCGTTKGCTCFQSHHHTGVTTGAVIYGTHLEGIVKNHQGIIVSLLGTISSLEERVSKLEGHVHEWRDKEGYKQTFEPKTSKPVGEVSG